MGELEMLVLIVEKNNRAIFQVGIGTSDKALKFMAE